MSKKNFLGVFGIVLAVGIYFFVSHPPLLENSSVTTLPTISLEKSICEKVTAKFGDCKQILLYDVQSNLVFVESSSGIIVVLTNKEFTEFKKIIGIMDFQEFKEEKTERGPIDWRAKKNVQKNFSIIYGFAESPAKSIVIKSEGKIQPNRFFVRDNLWVWYVTLPKETLTLPVNISVYGEDGQIIHGE